MGGRSGQTERASHSERGPRARTARLVSLLTVQSVLGLVDDLFDLVLGLVDDLFDLVLRVVDLLFGLAGPLICLALCFKVLVPSNDPSGLLEVTARNDPWPRRGQR